MVILGGWIVYVVEEKIYVVEEICKYECICWQCLVCSTTIRSAFNYALRILGYPCRRAMILTCNGPLKTPAPMILPFPSPSGVANGPSI